MAKKSIVVPALTGLSAIGTAFGSFERKAIMSAASIIAGELDYELRCANVYQLTGHAVIEESELYSPEADVQLARIKTYFRNMIENALDRADQQLRQEQAEKFASLQAQLRNSNRPHAQGTVAEIAARLGISKSEVRRRKADGTLDQLLSKAQS